MAGPLPKLFACLNPLCKTPTGWFNFTSLTPTCPSCGISFTDERFGSLLIKRLPRIHFDPPSPVPGYGMNHRACNPKIHICGIPNDLGQPDPFNAGTGLVTAVTCPECKVTAAFEKAFAEYHDESSGSGKLMAEGAMVRMRQFMVKTPD